MINYDDIELTDRVGNYLKLGDIVAYSTTSRSALNIGVFAGIKVKSVGLTSIVVTPLVRMIRRDGASKTQALKQTFSYDKRKFSGRLENMVVVQLPEFKLDIEEICQCFEIIDDLKDEGIIKEQDEKG